MAKDVLKNDFNVGCANAEFAFRKTNHSKRGSNGSHLNDLKDLHGQLAELKKIGIT